MSFEDDGRLLLELLQTHVPKFRSRGNRSWEGLCPWHNDRHPSLKAYVNPSGKLYWRCFVCPDRRGSSPYFFLTDGLGYSKEEASRELRRMKGIPEERSLPSPASSEIFREDRASNLAISFQLPEASVKPPEALSALRSAYEGSFEPSLKERSSPPYPETSPLEDDLAQFGDSGLIPERSVRKPEKRAFSSETLSRGRMILAFQCHKALMRPSAKVKRDLAGSLEFEERDIVFAKVGYGDPELAERWWASDPDLAGAMKICWKKEGALKVFAWFSERLTLPIWIQDERGRPQVVLFQGRDLSGNHAVRYLTQRGASAGGILASPWALYPLYPWKKEIFIVEGPKCAYKLCSRGMRASSTSGSSSPLLRNKPLGNLSAGQAVDSWMPYRGDWASRLLAKAYGFGWMVNLLLDLDPAGIAFAKRLASAFRELAPEGLLRVWRSDGPFKDPSELLTETVSELQEPTLRSLLLHVGAWAEELRKAGSFSVQDLVLVRFLARTRPRELGLQAQRLSLRRTLSSTKRASAIWSVR